MTALRPLLPSELIAAYDAIELAFGGDSQPEDRTVELSLIDPRRTLAAFEERFDDGRIFRYPSENLFCHL